MSASHISTSEDAVERAGGASPAETPGNATAPDAADARSIGASAALISVFVIISRITGFVRTWAMAFALGSTMLASSYQVANNLPNMLYELVVGGMLVTAFLPVYISVKDRLGERGGNEYASNLMSLTFIALGLVALACTLFAPALIFTQSFMNDQSTMDDAVFFFRFFAVQIVFYGLSTIVSGLLNASRDYLWSSAAPIFNNVIVTATFVLYAVLAPSDPEAAKLVIAIGNPLGVLVQMAIQLPALKRNGIRLRFRVDLHDPALKETLSIGVPAVVVMFAGLIIVSVQNAAAYGVLDNGPSIIAYARLWFTLPYSFLTVPITTAMFTEISHMHARGDDAAFLRGLVSGTNQILFFMMPFMLFLIVFAEPLVTLYHIGAFTAENIGQISGYLIALSVSLPFYGVNTYLQKAFSALRMMKHYAAMMVCAAAVQIAFIMAFSTGAFGLPSLGLSAVALSEAVFYLLLDICCFAFLHARMGSFGIRGILLSGLRSLALGAAGAAVGYGVVRLVELALPLDGSIPHALACIVAGGVAAVAVTFGIALKLRLEEASFITSIVEKVARRLGLALAANRTDEKIEAKVVGQSRGEGRTFAGQSRGEGRAEHAKRDGALDRKLSGARHAAQNSRAERRDMPPVDVAADEPPGRDATGDKIARAKHARTQSPRHSVKRPR